MGVFVSVRHTGKMRGRERLGHIWDIVVSKSLKCFMSLSANIKINTLSDIEPCVELMYLSHHSLSDHF